ncbi:hypothetical protein VYF65_004294 [Lysinibacillus irui]|uniref:hypothetical protein n=1 Tax=Lysinibacillus irui TaxID=2998077 RepID=UPI003884EE66
MLAWTLEKGYLGDVGERLSNFADIHDPEGDAISISVRSSDPSIFEITYSNGLVYYKALVTGSVNVTIIASDSHHGTTSYSFPVTVK